MFRTAYVSGEESVDQVRLRAHRLGLSTAPVELAAATEVRDIAAAMAKLIGSPGVESGDADVYLDALSRYGRTKVHFVDCIIAATARDQRVSVATFDQDFRKFPDVRVELGRERRIAHASLEL